MKAVVLSVAMLMGTMICANANAAKDAVSRSSEVVAVQDDFVDVKIESLNAKVQEAVRGFEDTCTVKSLAYNIGKKQTKVTLVVKADNTEKTVILDDEGKEVKDVKD
ncbi:MAG: hypothetical protein LBL24_04670 [Bacteroidales bacterium]|jgi:hypothetical protein|nr:hypothetical protein [Bacteroidales bacterium]